MFRPGFPPRSVLTVSRNTTSTNTINATRPRHHHGLSCRTMCPAAPTTRAHRTTTRGDVACCRHSLPIASGGRPPLALQLTRSKKTKTTVSLGDLPQGTIPLDPRPPLADHGSAEAGAGAGEEQPTYPTVLQQARRNMQRFASCVLLTRVGGFYELYFEHADEYGPLLNLKVAQKKTSVGPVPMAGFPFFQLDRFLKILVQDLGKYVAISEEFPNDAPDKAKSGGLMHDRKVARIITPGTLIDENFMDPYANNYVMAVHISEDAASGLEPESKPELPGGSQAPATTHAAAAAAAAAGSRATMGLAWADVSTGQFFTQAAELSALPSILARVGPREIVLADTLQARPDHDVFAALADDKHVVTYAPPGDRLTLEAWAPMLETDLSPDARAAFTHDEVSAGSLLLRYVRDRLLGLDLRLLPPLRHENMHVMTMDKNTLRSLEIKQTMRDGSYRGSLLHAVRRTVTKGGTRLLSEWLGAPSTSLAVIDARQDLVARFLADEDLRDGVVALLRRTHDSQRLVQKFALGRGIADDLLSLAGTIDASGHVASLLRDASTSLPPTNPEGSSAKDECLTAMADRLQLDEVLKLARRIRDAVDEEGLVQQHQLQDQEQDQMMALAQEVAVTRGSDEDVAALPKGAAAAASKKKPQQQKRAASIRDYYGQDNEAWIMKPDASPALRELHARLRGLQADRDALADRLRAELSAPGLTLRWTPGLGHICHVKGKQGMPLKPDADGGLRTLSSSRSTRSFHHPEWTRLGLALDHVRLRVRAEEQVVFRRLREHVVRALVSLRRNAAVLDELDVTASFARLARELGLTRPVLTDAPPAHKILGGRHPTVEAGLGEQASASSGGGGSSSGGGTVLMGAGSRRFVRNDCLVGSPGHGRAWLVTGPNMAGKSTFLRQNALITVLAQAGSYVPADHAELGLVDAIFSRVGSADNLYRDQSTFMVEMLETAHILRSATPRSFVVMDEIGRGTTPEDGAAVAYAALHHLATITRCRVLFATHFHAVADLAADAGLLRPDGSGEVEAYCTDVAEDGEGGFYYVHKLRRGINRQSHALKVARLAGLPESTIEVARQVLGRLGALAEDERSRLETTAATAPMDAKAG